MRAYLILAIILGAAPLCLFSPYFGVLMWSWVSYFNPHRYVWGFVYNLPVGWIIGAPTLCGALFHFRKTNRRLVTREALFMLLLWMWFAWTTYYATLVPDFVMHASEGQVQMIKVSKILLMTFVSMAVITSFARLKFLLYIIAFSFGIRAVAAAIFVVQTAGQYRVYGPPGSFLEENNAFGLALNMALPIMYYLGEEEQNRWLRAALKLSFYSTIIAIAFTYSRGALLGLMVVLLLVVLRSRQKLLAILIVALGLPLLVTMAPQHWTQRMGRFFVDHELNETAKQRLVSWGFAWNFVQDYPLGGGFDTFSDVDLYHRYQPEPLPGSLTYSGPHSIYFQMLAEHGFVGLALFLLLLFSCFASLRTIRRRGRAVSSIVSYSTMLETSLVAYMVSGAFLGLGYFDLTYQLVAIVSILKTVYASEIVGHASVPILSGNDARQLQDTAAACVGARSVTSIGERL